MRKKYIKAWARAIYVWICVLGQIVGVILACKGVINHNAYDLAFGTFAYALFRS